MKQIQNGLITDKYTQVYQEEDFKFNAPHHFQVRTQRGVPNGKPVQELIQCVNFQEGPIKENGVNGVNNEDLIAMVISRLEHFQDSDFRCRENAVAITKLQESLMWLRKRTMDREARGVEGTHIK